MKRIVFEHPELGLLSVDGQMYRSNDLYCSLCDAYLNSSDCIDCCYYPAKRYFNIGDYDPENRQLVEEQNRNIKLNVLDCFVDNYDDYDDYDDFYGGYDC